MHDQLRNRLVHGGGWVVGSKVVSLLSALAFNGLIARILSPDDVGLYFVLVSVVSLAVMLALGGMARSIVRIVSRSIALNRSFEALAAIRYVLFFASLSSSFIAVLTILFSKFLLADGLSVSETISGIRYYLVVWLIALTMLSLTSEIFRGLHDIPLASVFNGMLATIISGIAFCAIFLSLKAANVYMVLKVICISHLVELTLALIVLRVRIKPLRSSRSLSHDHSALRGIDVFNTSWPIFFVDIALFCVIQGPIFLLSYGSSKEAVAIYGAMLKIGVIISGTLNLARQAIAPTIGELYAKNQIEDVEKVLRSAATMAGIPSIIALLVAIFFGKTIIGVVYGSYYTGGYWTLVILCLAQIVNVGTGAPGVLLVMAGKERVLLVFSLVAAAMGLGIGVILLPSVGVLGTAIGTGIAIAFHNILTSIYSARRLKVKTIVSFKLAVNWGIGMIRPFAIRARWLLPKISQGGPN